MKTPVAELKGRMPATEFLRWAEKMRRDAVTLKKPDYVIAWVVYLLYIEVYMIRRSLNDSKVPLRSFEEFLPKFGDADGGDAKKKDPADTLAERTANSKGFWRAVIRAAGKPRKGARERPGNTTPRQPGQAAPGKPAAAGPTEARRLAAKKRVADAIGRTTRQDRG